MWDIRRVSGGTGWPGRIVMFIKQLLNKHLMWVLNKIKRPLNVTPMDRSAWLRSLHHHHLHHHCHHRHPPPDPSVLSCNMRHEELVSRPGTTVIILSRSLSGHKPFNRQSVMALRRHRVYWLYPSQQAPMLIESRCQEKSSTKGGWEQLVGKFNFIMNNAQLWMFIWKKSASKW